MIQASYHSGERCLITSVNQRRRYKQVSQHTPPPLPPTFLDQLADFFVFIQAVKKKEQFWTTLFGTSIIADRIFTKISWRKWRTQTLFGLQKNIKRSQNSITSRAQNVLNCCAQRMLVDVKGFFPGCGQKFIYQQNYFWRHHLTISIHIFTVPSSSDYDEAANGRSPTWQYQLSMGDSLKTFLNLKRATREKYAMGIFSFNVAAVLSVYSWPRSTKNF